MYIFVAKNCTQTYTYTSKHIICKYTYSLSPSRTHTRERERERAGWNLKTEEAERRSAMDASTQGHPVITPLAELHRSGSPGAIIAHLISPPPPLHPLRSHFLSFPMMGKDRGNDREQKISVLLTFVCFHVAGSKVSVYSVTWLIGEVNLLSHSPWVQRWGRRYEAGDVSTLGDGREFSYKLVLEATKQCSHPVGVAFPLLP